MGAGLAGLVAAAELTAAGRTVALVDQEGPNDLGGQAFWSLGGLFLVDTPEQRRLGVKDSFDLAWSDWQGSAKFDRLADQDRWAVQWARAYVEWAAGEKRDWLVSHGVTLTPVVGWAERGDLRADGHGNSVPRFHVAWGTGTGVVEPFVRAAHEAAARGLLTFHPRHRVDELVLLGRSRDGSARHAARRRTTGRAAQPTSREPAGEFELSAQAVVAHHRRDRRRPRPRPSLVARAPRHAAPRDDHRRAGVRRRPHARHRRGGGRRTSSTATGCGTTPRASRTGTRSGRATASGSCRARRRCGSTRSAGACPTRACPATTRSARCGTCGRRPTSSSTTTPGSSSRRRSSRRSSGSPAPSRTPTSPAATARRSCATGC